MKKNYRTNQREFRIEKVIKKKGDKLYVKWKGYFPKPYEPFGGDINVKIDLPNYATKTDIKSITHVDTSGFALKSKFR